MTFGARSSKGFPRPRGDGPLPRRTKWTKQKVSPPTRGWTAACRPRRPTGEGFPAHAGMDPGFSSRSDRSTRFPRPRGDGPPEEGVEIVELMVSPPTRGWTPLRPARLLLPVGFPAHAGMDLVGRVDAQVPLGFPRPRGDGPATGVSFGISDAVSPPTRGWTHRRPGARRNSLGFPAHAGMDRRSLTARRPPPRFPRPRGDGPRPPHVGSSIKAVSPPTRGWTSFQRKQRGRVPGFPAHAGMDLSVASASVMTTWFPRPRGDGPSVRDRLARHLRVSPPTRGWTSCLRCRYGAPEGFPAHAGMDPTTKQAR